ncbi:acetoacetyl-CoA synthetase-like [Stegodyphus dumicola]|uniref:acetoacetyl-CoA synthetase-like n=1 Tax=Stegodyphus dumicola TaxID=202533 RepID=UPI0015AD68DE|nr:acetoacetyl-CoA synthetase-like [Stegodyphus dumicola]
MGKKDHSKLVGFRSVLSWDKKVPDTQLEKFKKVVEKKFNLHFDSYWDFHKWSIENSGKFWEEIWNYFGMIVSKPYEQIIAFLLKKALQL